MVKPRPGLDRATNRVAAYMMVTIERFRLALVDCQLVTTTFQTTSIVSDAPPRTSSASCRRQWPLLTLLRGFQPPCTCRGRRGLAYRCRSNHLSQADLSHVAIQVLLMSLSRLNAT